MKFLHAADIHLDSPRGGLDRDPEAPADDIQRAPRRALENLVHLALQERVDFVLIAGDLYDGDWKDYRTGLFFVEQMRRLKDAGIETFLIAGNHDAANKMTRTLNLRDLVTLFDPDEPQTKHPKGHDVAIHGQSFAKQAVLEDLSAGYPAKKSGWFNIGLLHTCATNTEHDPYAPCTPQGLQRKGYDYWALGHVHTRQSLHEAGAPPIHFPGNVQGRHIRETGAKGCLIVTVDGRGVPTTRFEPLDVFRWERLAVDATGAERGDDVVDRFAAELQRAMASAEDRPLAVRIEIQGACRAHEALASEPGRWAGELRSVATQTGHGRVWIERVNRSTSLPPDDRPLHDGPVGELIEYLDELRRNDTLLAAILQDADELRTLHSRLPTALTEGPDSIPLTEPAHLRGLLDDVQQLLTQRLLNRGAL